MTNFFIYVFLTIIHPFISKKATKMLNKIKFGILYCIVQTFNVSLQCKQKNTISNLYNNHGWK